MRILLVIVAFLVLCSSASATDRGLKIAEEAFPGHCDGREQVVSNKQSDEVLDAIPKQDPRFVVTGLAKDPVNCVELIRTGMDAIGRCEVEVHEKGHLEGWGHPDQGAPASPDPDRARIMNSVMPMRPYEPCLAAGGPDPLEFVTYVYFSRYIRAECDDQGRTETMCTVYLAHHRFLRVLVGYTPDASSWWTSVHRRGLVKNL